MQGKNEVMLEFHVDDTTGASEVGPFFCEWCYEHVNFWVHICQYPLCYWLDLSKVRLGSTIVHPYAVNAWPCPTLVTAKQSWIEMVMICVYLFQIDVFTFVNA